jgi:uncharacterized protein
MDTATPAQVLQRRQAAVLSGDTEGFVSLFAPDGVIELPFAPPDTPARLAGQTAIRDFATHVAASPLHLDDLQTTAMHQTSDPEVVIVELTWQGRLTSTGQSLAGTSIQVFRIRDGKIVLFRDYNNPRGFEELLYG